jgi:hypothetical protein
MKVNINNYQGIIISLLAGSTTKIMKLPTYRRYTISHRSRRNVQSTGNVTD